MSKEYINDMKDDLNNDKSNFNMKCQSRLTHCTSCNRDTGCVAHEKILDFYEGKLPLSTAYNAFVSASPAFLSDKTLVNADLIICLKYFIQISEPDQIASRLEKFNNKILNLILKANYIYFVEMRSEFGDKYFFDTKPNRFWKFISEEKRLEMIDLLIQEEEFKLAALFLLILSPTHSQVLTENIVRDREIEKRLYLSLEDDIFTLAQINPELYFRLISMLTDDQTGMLEVLKEYEATANDSLYSLNKAKEIMSEFENVKDSVYQLQWFYSKLKNMDSNLRQNIVTLLEREEKITRSDKQLLESLFKDNANLFHK